MTVREAALQLDCSDDTIRREIAAGRLGCARIGPGARRIFIAQSDVDDYLAACREPARGQVPAPKPRPVVEVPVPASLARLRERVRDRAGRS